MFYVLLFLFFVLLIATMLLNQKKFGKIPAGQRLERLQKSPHYKNGSFQNLSETPGLTDEATYFSVLFEFIFNKNKRLAPKDQLPFIKTNIHKLDNQENVLIWFGHSSYFIQLDGKRFLIDPVFSVNASPFSFVTKAFEGTDIYAPQDMPDIDYLLLTHDHWDHLDYKTLIHLRPKIGKVICGLGIGAHLEHWSYKTDNIFEMDWHESINLEPGFAIHTVPARHFSGRGLLRNRALWTSFVLQTKAKQIFIGGDSGYDAHFAAAGQKFGSFDLAILENGQYNKKWKHIHLMPEEIIRAAKDLNANKLLTVHHAKFALSNHDWDEPLKKIASNSRNESMVLLTPMIGEKVILTSEKQVFSEWWQKEDNKAV